MNFPTPNTNRCLFMLCVGMGGHGCAHVMLWVGMGGHRSCMCGHGWAWVGIGHVCVGMGGHGCNLKGKCGPLSTSLPSINVNPREWIKVNIYRGVNN